MREYAAKDRCTGFRLFGLVRCGRGAAIASALYRCIRCGRSRCIWHMSYGRVDNGRGGAGLEGAMCVPRCR